MSFALLDWRRRIAAIYDAVRACPSPAEAHRAWREARDDLLAHHLESPVPRAFRAAFGGARYGPYEKALRFEVTVETGLAPATHSAETGSDGTVIFDRVGRVELDGLGSLDCWWLRGYGGGLFVPLRDPSPLTYGGGRYLIDTAKGADLGGDFDPQSGRGTLVVDLNFAYQPSCAYDPSWACPLAPATNALEVPLEAGELVGPAR